MIKLYVNGLSGKMGQSINRVVQKSEAYKIINHLDISIADAYIDFSSPKSCLEMLEKCIKYKIPAIIGTTGFSLDEILVIRRHSNKIPILMKSNFSKGIGCLMNQIKEHLSSSHEFCKCVIKEIHHNEKVDFPSGTALELKKFILLNDKKNLINSIKLVSERVDNEFGTHEVDFISRINSFKFKHNALSRSIYASGALDAASNISFYNKGLHGFQANSAKTKNIF